MGQGAAVEVVLVEVAEGDPRLLEEARHSGGHPVVLSPFLCPRAGHQGDAVDQPVGPASHTAEAGERRVSQPLLEADQSLDVGDQLVHLAGVEHSVSAAGNAEVASPGGGPASGDGQHRASQPQVVG